MAAIPARPLSVLLVEDNRDLADSLALYLELCCSFAVRVARDGEAGLAAALADPPDAVVCDIGLPKRSGLEVAAAVRGRLGPGPLLIAVTGYGDMRDRALAAGFDHFLTKPADPAELEALLRARQERLAGGSG